MTDEPDAPAVRVTHLDETERIAVAGTIWRPLRRPLGVTAFGINAYTADNAGDDVIEPHDELGSGAGRHEELYLVVSGHARFEVAGAAIDAPAGTVVFVADPAAQRYAVAEAADTTVVVIGGRAGDALPVSPFEHWFAAEPAYQAEDYDRAIEIASAGLADHPDHPVIHYQLACYHALAGHPDEALDHLGQAVAGDPRARGWAAGDRDLDGLRDHPRYPA
jgi:hypothetical protein